MDKHVYLWRGVDKVELTFGDPPNGFVRKLVHVKNHVFVYTTTNYVYGGRVASDDDTTAPNVTVKRIDFNAVDIAANSDHLFVVNHDGRVFKIDPDSLEVVDTIVLKDEIKFCSHGYKQENEPTRVKTIAVSDNAALYVTDNGQLWASGDQPQIDVRSPTAKRVIFFEGRIISEVACGNAFNVAIARKIPKTAKDDTSSENDVEEVFVNSCPHCLSNVTLSPVSLTSSDTCPMSFHRQQYSEDQSVISTSSLSNTSKDTKEIETNESSNLTNLDDASGNFGDSEKEEKKNVIFINTEAARQFLTRQLSWVSSYGNAKEEPQSSTDSSTDKTGGGSIKQNVSTMANLVYEGVKNMGDKVVTLSRHMSGSSDINDGREDIVGDFEHIGDDDCKRTSMSVAHSLRCEEFPWSSSNGSLDHELSQQGLNERINSLIHAGNNLLSTELWTWGDYRHGQLGTGDLINRSKPVLVTKLNNTGIKKISCGDCHTLALTLDGRVYGWGKNDHRQVHRDSSEDRSSPQLFVAEGATNERAKDMAAGDRHSLIMMHRGLFFSGKSSKSEKPTVLDVTERKDWSSNSLSCSGPYSCCAMINRPISDISEDLINDQIFLEEMLLVYQNLIKPFQKKSGTVQESNVYEILCRCYAELMSFTALNVLSLWDYFNDKGEAYDVVLIANVDEFVTVYKYYLNAICDVISLGGFTHMAKIINDVPQPLKRTFSYKIRTGDSEKICSEAVITTALKHPLNRLNKYKAMILHLITSNGDKMGIERLQEGVVKWERLWDEQEKRQKEAEVTRAFWENSGKLVELLRSPERRLIRESRTYPLAILNSGRFTTHWFVLLTDIFVHVIGTSNTVHQLPTLWVEPLADSETLQNVISITAPEDALTLYTPTPTERNEWLQALQNAIKCSLHRIIGHVPPLVRTSSYCFTKHQFYKDAKYNGRWLNGKPHGIGKLEWNDGRMYTGQFHKGVIQGWGKMEIPTQGIYEGQWKDGQQNGHGTFKYINGDVYEGYFKDGSPHGHGMKKEGHFMASVASVYIGEWANGVKQGYGIRDDIMTGEKYLGSWSNDMKHGCGLIVTLDGIYYEGAFVQDVLTGHGVMVFEDGTHYEGDFKSAGIYGGKGTLTFRSGDRLEGNISGVWNEGVKVNAVLHINKAIGASEINAKPASFGKLCVPPDQKWRAIFRQCYQQLGISETAVKTAHASTEKSSDSQRIWQSVAVIISKSHQKTLERRKASSSKATETDQDRTNECLNRIPNFGRDKLTVEIYGEVHEYLVRAFESSEHPLGALLVEIAAVYTATYGGVRVHPLLLSHAVAELRSITARIYELVTLFFPALPRGGQEYVVGNEDDGDSKVISAAAILHPILLPRVHSALFVLYALHNKKEDDAYWERLIKWNKQPDITLMGFLDIEQKFWGTTINLGLDGNALTNERQSAFTEAIETLQQLKTTFSPLEKLCVIRNTFERITQTVQKQLGETYLWTMDELFPVFSFVVVRARVLQLGSEINFIEDFMEPYLENGELGIMFTTLKACYYQILQEKMSMAD